MLLVVFLCSLIVSLLAASEDHQEIKVKPGQDVPLQCRALRNASVKLSEWTRPDLKSDGYVFFYRNERPYENFQHESFHGRVELRDPEMKDGDASVVLKNVTFNDTGTYECRIVTNARQEIKHLIDLKVTDSGGLVESRLLRWVSRVPTPQVGLCSSDLLIGQTCFSALQITQLETRREETRMNFVAS
ncbi:coxsackievirus and adenovirus receptor homolog isoform X3 [Micropterus salmoides]|uniref:coxsackievirus and adenovirus receptor homolog isoform X3 n=1 Tax=Micropterus salmoides TaxID=27706 RepID=UPI0018EBD6BB|nr:coxsackievirus and adenovirus receptor homolog isoform X3 [Micropterus salmoides]